MGEHRRIWRQTLEEHLTSRIRKTDECWYWTGTVDKDGYGRAFDPDLRKPYRAHRAVYEMLAGPIPEGLQLDHECHNADPDCPGGKCIHRLCVRPDHLVPRTSLENARRGRGTASLMVKSRTSCLHGHSWTEENTYLDKAGRRYCRACNAASSLRRWRATAELRTPAPRKTHCKRGHPFDEVNTYWRLDRPNVRQCRACSRQRQSGTCST